MFENRKLIQKHGLFKKTTFTLIENREIEVSFNSITRSETYKYSLDRVSQDTHKFRRIDTKSVTWFVFLGLISAFCLSVAPLSTDQDKVALIVTGAIFGFAAFACLLNVFKNSSNLIVFSEIEGGPNLFGVSPKKPSHREVEGFVNEIKNRIQSIRYPRDLPQERKNDIYRKHLDFLRHEGVISEEEHSKILDRLLEKENKSNVIKLVQ